MKLIVSDFDRTFYDDNYEENIKLINEFVAKGNMFVIATGRPLYLLKEDLIGYKISYSYLICKDGAVIFDKKGNKIFQKDIPNEIASQIYDILDNDKNMRETYLDNTSELTIDKNDSINSIISRPSDMERAQDTLECIKKEFDIVDGYISKNWLNITHKDVSKGMAIHYLQNLLEIKNEDIYTIGDSVNDISMNSMYNSYAVKDSDEGLYKVSNHSVDSFKEFMEAINEDNNN